MKRKYTKYDKDYYEDNKKAIVKKKDTMTKIGRKSLNALSHVVNSTEQAINFGNYIKDNPHAKAGIVEAQKYWQEQFDELFKKDEDCNTDLLIELATKIQFCREALEASN